jgi:hypothetical protein
MSYKNNVPEISSGHFLLYLVPPAVAFIQHRIILEAGGSTTAA